MWSIVSSWFCCDELGSKRAPIPYSSIFPLAATLQQALLCAVRSIQGICVQGSVGQIRLLKFQSVEMSEKLQTTFWMLLTYSPWTSGNQKCMAIGNTFWNYYFFKGNLVKRQRRVLKQTTNAIFDTESIEPNSALVQIHHVTEKVVYMIFSIKFRKKKKKKTNIKNNTDSPAIAAVLWPRLSHIQVQSWAKTVTTCLRHYLALLILRADPNYLKNLEYLEDPFLSKPWHPHTRRERTIQNVAELE